MKKTLTLTELRERAQLTKAALARAVGVCRLTIIHWERGDSQPRFAHQCLLIQSLRCSIEELLAALALLDT